MEKEDAVNVLQFWLAADNFQSQLAAKKGQYDGQEAQNDAMILYDKWGSSRILCFCTCGFVLCCAEGTSLQSCVVLLRCILSRWHLMCLHTWTFQVFWYTWGEILTRIPFLNIIQNFQDLIAWVCLVGEYQSWLVDIWKWKGFKPNNRYSTAEKP